MSFALAKAQKQFISRIIRQGRVNSQSEVVREALRRLEAPGSAYLSPPPLTPDPVDNIYGHNRKEELREQRLGRDAFAVVRRTLRKGARL